jgi:cytochrome b6-f complex iron-sulfur subunit
MSRLDRYVQAIVRNRRPTPFVPTDDEASTMAAAIALSAARPRATQPRPEFVDQLRARLDRPEPTRVPRRGVVIGGSVAAGAAVVGAAVGAAVDRLITTEPSGGTIEPNDGQWHTVATSESVPDGGAVAFNTGTLSGFVIRQEGALTARSGVCTHQGCHLRLNDAERRLDCPCHRTRFAFDGQVITSQLPNHPPRLPAIQVREQGGEIQVLV